MTEQILTIGTNFFICSGSCRDNHNSMLSCCIDLYDGSDANTVSVHISIANLVGAKCFLIARAVDLSIVERAFEDSFSGTVGGSFGVAEIGAGRRPNAGLRRRRGCRQKHNRRRGRQ